MSQPTINEVLDAAEENLEAENRHDESICRLWNAVKAYIPSKDRLKAVQALACAMGAYSGPEIESQTHLE